MGRQVNSSYIPEIGTLLLVLMFLTIIRTVRNSVVQFSCRMDSTECVQKSKDYFSELMKNPSSQSIPAVLRATAYCTAIRNGGQAEFDFLFAQLGDGSNALTKSDVLSGLS